MKFLRLGLLLLTPALLAAADVAAHTTYKQGASRAAVSTPGGFCRDGVYGSTAWPKAGRPENLAVWGSFCANQNDDTGHFESQPFLAPKSIELFLAGYAGQPGRRLALRDVQSGAEVEFKPTTPPAEVWTHTSFAVPTDWRGKKVRLVAVDEAKGMYGWLGFTLPILPPASLVVPLIDTSAPQAGFCSGGAYGPTKWPSGTPPEGIATWGSFCGRSDGDTGWFATPPFKGDRSVQLYIAGYPDAPGLAIAVENVKTGEQFPLRVNATPGEAWEPYQFKLPHGWRRQAVRVIARDQATGSRGWLAFSNPVPVDTGREPLSFESAAWLLAILMGPGLVALGLSRARRNSDWRIAAVAALVVFAAAFFVYFTGGDWEPLYGLLAAGGGLLLAGIVVLPLARRSGAMAPWTAADRKKFAMIAAVWIGAVVAILPVVFGWPAPKPDAGVLHGMLIAAGFAMAGGICYAIYRVELPRLGDRRTLALVFLVVLLNGLINNIHNYNVDTTNTYVPRGNQLWQKDIHDLVIQLSTIVIPHSYRFLPNGLVRWMEVAGLDFFWARDLYRMLVGLLLFYAIYRFARLFCNFNGAVIAMLLCAAIFPVSFEYYAGQLTDPLAHLSFVIALIFLETQEFAWLLTTLVIGSLAKETVLALAGYYIVFRRGERNYSVKAVTLAVSSAAVFLGVRSMVLEGAFGYKDTSGVTPAHIGENLAREGWTAVFLLTGCALLPFLWFAWKDTALELKRMTFYLLPLLFVSSLLFSWLNESRNFMPVVFVLAVVAGGYLSRSFSDDAAPPALAAPASATARSSR
jgi:hypothetical protein